MIRHFQKICTQIGTYLYPRQREQNRIVLFVQWLGLFAVMGAIIVALIARSSQATVEVPPQDKNWIERGRFSGMVILQSSPKQAEASQTENDVVCSVEYIVEEGDWLSKLADQFFGDILQYPAIVEATNQRRGVDDSFAEIIDPDLIEPGWKLCIAGIEGDVAEVNTDEANVVEVHDVQMVANVADDETQLPVQSEATAEMEEHQPSHWSYMGETGPEFWGNLDPTFQACATGTVQSPIDIASLVMSDLQDVTFNYQMSALNIVNNGHTIQVDYEAGSSIELDGDIYELLQFHFHTPSEHTIGGKVFAMEMHLVHQNDAGELAVVGVMIREGQENRAFAPIWNNLPTLTESAVLPTEVLNAETLLPTKHLSYRYNGSLTTPPCSEGVKWIILTTPIELSSMQIDAFKSIFEANSRPLQPLNKRSILLDAGHD